MFLRATWRRALLVAAVITLGLLRNALRILVVTALRAPLVTWLHDQQRHSSS